MMPRPYVKGWSFSCWGVAMRCAASSGESVVEPDMEAAQVPRSVSVDVTPPEPWVYETFQSVLSVPAVTVPPAAAISAAHSGPM